MSDLTVLILTFNEERHIARAIRSVATIAKEIVVIDSYSADKTVEIATALGARILQHPFVNQARQFQWGLDNAPINTSWVMRLDADEVIEDDLVAEIAAKLPKLSSDITGVNLKRKHIFMGRWIRHGGRYPLILLRIWRHGLGRVEDIWMDEHIQLLDGRATTFNGGFADINLQPLSHFIQKHNQYATREALQVITGSVVNASSRPRDPLRGSMQFRIKRVLKEQFYNKLPFPISSFSYFIYRYFLQFGFLDGLEGLIYHFLQGAWYRFLVGAKIYELKKSLDKFSPDFTVSEILSAITGYDLIINELS